MVIETRERPADERGGDALILADQARLDELRTRYAAEKSRKQSWPAGLLQRWIALPKAALLNVAILGSLLIAMIAETIEYGDLTVPLFYLPLLLAFGSFARRLAVGPGSVRVLRTSALASLILGVLAVWGFETSVTSSPTDYVCIAMSLPLTALFGYAAWWQHRASER